VVTGTSSQCSYSVLAIGQFFVLKYPYLVIDEGATRKEFAN